jgi:hypothetical protein
LLLHLLLLFLLLLLLLTLLMLHLLFHLHLKPKLNLPLNPLKLLNPQLANSKGVEAEVGVAVDNKLVVEPDNLMLLLPWLKPLGNVL